MSLINDQFSNLENSSHLTRLDGFETFDINKFAKGKTFAIEQVLVDDHIKIETRIVEDNTEYKNEKSRGANVGKLVTFVIHEEYTEQLNIVNIVGKKLEVYDIDNEDAIVYGLNNLKVYIKHLRISDEKVSDFYPSKKLNKSDRRLAKMNEFKTFNYKKFLSVHEYKILTIYPQTPTTARIIGIITKDNFNAENNSNVGKTFSIKIEMTNVRDIPLELLLSNLPFTIDNLDGHITGMVLKNNQVLLTADNFIYDYHGKTLIIGDNSTDELN